MYSREIDSDVSIAAVYHALIAGLIQATEEGFISSRRLHYAFEKSLLYTGTNRQVQLHAWSSRRGTEQLVKLGLGLH